jgi:hypothetical protein
MRFTRNKYRRWYNLIVAKAKSLARTKKKDGPYFERHHILPKSMGGSDHQKNLVLLTAKEHFICHWLLTKCTSGMARRSAVFSFGGLARRLNGSDSLTSAQYSKLVAAKREAAILAGGPSLESCRKGGLAMKGYKHRPEFGLALSLAQKGKTLTPEHRANISMGRKRSDLVKKALDHLHSDQVIAEKKRASMLRTLSTEKGKSQRATMMQARASAGYPKDHRCEYCGNTFTKSRYTAFHGLKCRSGGPVWNQTSIKPL